MTLADALRGLKPTLSFHGERRVIRGDDGPMQAVADQTDTRPIMERLREFCREVCVVTSTDVAMQFALDPRHASTLLQRLKRKNFIKEDGFGHSSGGRLPRRYRVVE